MDFNENTATEAVLNSFANIKDQRLKAIMNSIITHLHQVVKEVEPTDKEWLDAIMFLTNTGQKCDDRRQEFILLSDVLGVSMLIDSINNRKSKNETETTVLGPFHAPSPKVKNGDNIAKNVIGDRCIVSGIVLDVNNNLIQGERVVTNQGINGNGNMWFTIAVNNASIVTNNGIINWSSNRTREWVSGIATYGNVTDDTYKIIGSASGTGINNNSFSMEITDTLNIDLGCLPSCVIKSGTAKISPNGYSDRIINYGDSLCDCNFDITINGTNYPIVVN